MRFEGGVLRDPHTTKETYMFTNVLSVVGRNVDDLRGKGGNCCMEPTKESGVAKDVNSGVEPVVRRILGKETRAAGRLGHGRGGRQRECGGRLEGGFSFAFLGQARDGRTSLDTLLDG